MQHPAIWKFIEALRKLQNINKNKIEALCAQGPPAKRRKYKDLDARLKTIVEDFANRDVLDFLKRHRPQPTICAINFLICQITVNVNFSAFNYVLLYAFFFKSFCLFE